MHLTRGEGVLQSLAFVACLAGLPACAQSVISAKAGLVHHTEGRASLNAQPLPRDFGVFPQMKDGDTFLTGRGRAEILLAPGVFLRLGQRTAIRMISDMIMDAKVELVSGEAVLEAASLQKAETVTMPLLGAIVSITKRGLYHLETNPVALRVFKGKALVLSGDRRIEVARGEELLFDGAWTKREFDRSQTDALDMWSDGRSRLMASAEAAAALRDSEHRDEDEFSAARLYRGFGRR